MPDVTVPDLMTTGLPSQTAEMIKLAIQQTTATELMALIEAAPEPTTVADAQLVGVDADGVVSKYPANDVSPALNPAIAGVAPDTGANFTSQINSFYISKKTVSFEKGTFTADLNPWSGMIVEGRGKGQTIIQPWTTSFLLPFTGQTDIVFRNLTLRGFGALLWQNSGAKYTFENCAIDYGVFGFATNANPASVTPTPNITISDFRVINCEISNLTGAAANLPCVMQSAFFMGNHVHDIVGGGRIVGGIHLGLDGNTPTPDQWAAQRNIVIQGNVFEDFDQTTKTGSSSPGNNYELHGVSVKGRKAAIVGNVFRNIQGVKLDNEAIYTKCQMVSVVGNIVENSGSTEAAINIKGSATEPRGDLFVVADNVIRYDTYLVDAQDLTRTGIHVANDKGIIANNVITGANGNGVTVEGDSPNYQDIRVTGNIVRDHKGEIGIQLRGGGDRIAVANNQVSFGDVSASSGNYLGIAVLPASGSGTGYNDVLISENVVKMGAGMNLSGSASASGIRITGTLPINNLVIRGGIVDVDAALPSALAIDMRTGASNVITDFQIMEVDMPGTTAMSLQPATAMRMRQAVSTTTTTNTTATAITLPVATASVMSVKTKVTAAAVATTNSAYYERVGLFQRYTSSAPLQVGSTQTPITIENVTGAWTSELDVNNNNVRVRLNGDAGQTVNWRTVVEVETLS